MNRTPSTRPPARPPRPARLLAALATLVAGALVLVPSAAQAAPSQEGRDHANGWYLALGDSLAAGYQPGRTPPEDRAGGYVGGVLDAIREDTPKTRLVNLACSGATSTQLLSGGGRCEYDAGSQLADALAFLHAHGRHTRVVTLTIGSNDVTPCLALTGQDQAACVGSRLATLRANLTAITTAIHEEAPGARLVVTDYYNPFYVAWFSGGNAALVPLMGLLQALNGTIAAGVGDRGTVADVAGAFDSYVTTPVAGGVPTNVARICQWTWMCSRGDIHANDAGYAVIAEAVAARLD